MNANTQPTIANITFVGGGNMAAAIITGMVQKGGFSPKNINVIEPNEAQRDRLAYDFNVNCYENLAFAQAQMTTAPDIWVLAVKPQSMRDVLQTLTPQLQPAQILLSIAAGLPIATLASWSNGHSKIVRTMPNTPALVGQGITGVFADSISEAERTWVNGILQSIGQTVWLANEAQIDAVTAISGSGPAYVFYMMEQLIQDALALGFDETTAKQLVQATFAGAVALAGESTESISTLRERVTSKGGTTAAALATFSAQGLDTAIHAGVAACKARAEELAKELSV